MTEPLYEKIQGVALTPGVYLMKNLTGEVIYVGKARNLKKRLSSYFSGQLDPKTSALIKNVTAFETILTATENEALILESNLIKQYRPKYNVILKDDKRYPLIRLDAKSAYPSLTVVRKIKNDGAIYFGPFSSATAVKSTLKTIHKTFKLRKCKTEKFKNRSRPCLNYQMGACLGPCCIEIDPLVYKEIVKEVSLFLNGRAPELIRKIKAEMVQASAEQAFEHAAALRDKMFALEHTIEKQIVVSKDLLDRDVLGIAGALDHPLITLLFIRAGQLIGTRHFPFSETLSDPPEMVEAFIRQYYEKAHFIPDEILLPVALETFGLVEAWLKNTKGKKVSIIAPQRGEKAQLVGMAVQNAENELKIRIIQDNEKSDMLVRLQRRLELSNAPIRIECFDNSNIAGSQPVAGMVVFKNGKPDKASYRKYTIKTVEGPDDYASMNEVLTRRFTGSKSAMPDLLMIDGGRGQLNIALSVIKSLHLDNAFDVTSIAKKDETKGQADDKVYKPGRVNPINFGREEDLLLFLQQVRDEAHRFAISFHRKRRSTAAIHSVFDDIPGVGKKRKEVLLTHFGGIEKIQAATLDELSALPGMNKKSAEAILEFLKTVH